ncbi:hypothetical protein J4E90_006970 [Alternaria incomplexa]|uniref:uncharacterized protein n=1 Tax=Alternaria incomplexa TaxID=1187928 RepID=UPI002220A392|nr:uncharacterized protein J4E90_006970 [Alternaria incomplexa]KAI4910715.1 hypothetical protein J4E90_006970 [Alternaria incomplexa]
MTSSQDIPIETLTYTLSPKKSHLILDGLIDRMPPISALTDPLPKNRVCGSLGIFPTEILLKIIEDLTIRDTMRFRRCCRFAMHLVDTESPLRYALKWAPNTKGHRRPASKEAVMRARYVGDIGHEDLSPVVPRFRLSPVTLTNGVNRFWIKAEENMYDWDYVDEMYPHRAQNPRDTGRERYSKYWLKRCVFLGELKAQFQTGYRLTAVDVVPKRTVMGMCSVWAPAIDPVPLVKEKKLYCLCCLGTTIKREVYTMESFLVHLRDVCRVRPIRDVYRVRPKGVWNRVDLPELVLASD